MYGEKTYTTQGGLMEWEKPLHDSVLPKMTLQILM